MPGWNFVEIFKNKKLTNNEKRQGTVVCLEKQARPDNADALCGRCVPFGNESQRAPGERAPRRLSADLRTLFKNACVFEGESNRRGSTKDENRTLISDILLKQSDIFALQKLYCSLCSQLYSICSCNLKLPKAISLRSNITELAQ